LHCASCTVLLAVPFCTAEWTELRIIEITDVLRLPAEKAAVGSVEVEGGGSASGTTSSGDGAGAGAGAGVEKK